MIGIEGYCYILPVENAYFMSAVIVEILELEQVCLHWSSKIFLGEKHLVKNWLISALPRQGNLLQRNNFSGVYKSSLHFTK
jgi:hypothetical protein